jgi:hypothetical protein
MKYRIGNNFFKTQEEAKQYVRNVVRSINEEVTPENPQFEIIHDIVKCHRFYEIKKGCGIKSFFTIYNTLNKSRELNIKRVDDSIIDISFIVCAEDSIIDKNKLKVHKLSFKLYDAMRSAIKDQILAYRNNNRGDLEVCAICNIKNSKNIFDSSLGFGNLSNNINIEFQVDHKKPSFKFLRENFINEKKNLGCRIPTNFIDDQFNIPNFIEEDNEFKNDWCNYHAQNATFQILCKLCNLRKKKD